MADVKENKNPQGFYFNQQMCIGCRTCQVACKDKNDLEVGYLFRRVESFEVGEFPAPATFHSPGPATTAILRPVWKCVLLAPLTSTRKTARCSMTMKRASAAATA